MNTDCLTGQNGIGPIDSKVITREAKHNESVFIPLINKWSQLVNVLISVCIAKDCALLGIKTEHLWLKTT